MDTSERVQLLKAHAMKFTKDDVVRVLDIVGGEYFRRGSAFTQGEAVHTMVTELATALRQIPAPARASLRELVHTF